MVASITINPFQQTVGNAGLFTAKSDGVRQGTAYPDPATRYRLRGCLLASTETLPMWGGVAVYMDVPGGSGNPSYSLGPLAGRATALTGSYALAGFSVFDQAYNGITSPQSPVPLYGSGMTFGAYPLGSLARIAVACDPALVDLRGAAIGAQVSWDFVNQLLVPYLGSLTISSGTYNSTTGLVTLTMSADVTFDAGDSIAVASLTGTGTNLADLNGTFTATDASGTTVEYIAATGLGSIAITGGALTVGGSSDQALPVKVLDVMSSNCETVEYSAQTGNAIWNYDGSAAIIQI